MPLTPRGGGDIDQIRGDKLSGSVNAEQFLTTIEELRPAGNLLMFDAHGNAVNSGIPVTLLLSLLDTLIDDDGLSILDDDGIAIRTP